MIPDLELPPDLEENLRKREQPEKVGKSARQYLRSVLRIFTLTVVILALLIILHVKYAPELSVTVNLPKMLSESQDTEDQYSITMRKTRLKLIRSSCFDSNRYASSTDQDECWFDVARDSKISRFCSYISDDSKVAQCRLDIKDFLMNPTK